jgi:cytochrome c556
MWERNHRRARAALAGLALALLLAPPANAHDGATGVIKERMQAMDAMAKSMKTVGPMIRGQVSLDHEKAAAAARTIAAGAGEHLLRLFPAGSLMPPSDAKAEIWDDWARFEALANELADAAGRMEETAKDGADSTGMAAAFKGVGGVCADCHKEFRAKKR